MEIVGNSIYLRLLTPADATEKYMSWMNDPEVNQYLESRWYTHTIDSLRDYIREKNGSGCNLLFGIFLKSTGEHIGNIKIGSIHKEYRYGDLGLFIGEKSQWGRGYGCESIQLATRYAFEELKLNKLVAGVYSVNLGSYKAFMKAGYREVGRLKSHCVYKDRYIDEILVEKLHP